METIKKDGGGGWVMSTPQFTFKYGTVYEVEIDKEEPTYVQQQEPIPGTENCERCFFSTRNSDARWSCGGIDCVMIKIDDPLHASLLDAEQEAKK